MYGTHSQTIDPKSFVPTLKIRQKNAIVESYCYRNLSVLPTEDFVCAKFTSGSSFSSQLSSSQCFSHSSRCYSSHNYFARLIFILTVFVLGLLTGNLQRLSLFWLAMLSMFFKASRSFCWKCLAVFCRPSRMLLVVFVGRLRKFSFLSAVLEAFCCF